MGDMECDVVRRSIWWFWLGLLLCIPFLVAIMIRNQPETGPIPKGTPYSFGWKNKLNPERKRYHITVMLCFVIPTVILLALTQYFLCKTEYKCLCSELKTIEFPLFLGPLMYCVIRKYPTRVDRDRRALRGFCSQEP